VGEEFQELAKGPGIDRQTEYAMEYLSGIDDWAGKLDFDYLPSPSHYVKFGIGNIYHTFKPGVNVFSVSGYMGDLEEGIDTTFGNNNMYAHEMSAYLEDDWKISDRFKANIGVHASGFMVEDEFYYSVQPRLSTRVLLNEDLSLKGAYTQMAQYIHLLTNTTIGLPTDLWLPVTKKIKPLKSTQYALGAFYNLNNRFDFSLEGFYKDMHQLIEYKEGASFMDVTTDWQEKIEIGEGWAYGMEFMVQKNTGKTTGWIGYTLAWNNRQFENISFGEVFPAKYDRRHDIGIAVNHRFNETYDIGLTWVYGTGNAVTLPFEKYASMYSLANQGYYNYYESSAGVEFFDKRNNYRMPSYHRLDLGLNIHKPYNWGKLTWSFGVYNAYFRQNPFFLYFGYHNNHRVLKQVSLFPVAIPSISLKIDF
jgi:hypothetical protein